MSWKKLRHPFYWEDVESVELHSVVKRGLAGEDSKWLARFYDNGEVIFVTVYTSSEHQPDDVVEVELVGEENQMKVYREVIKDGE